MLSTAERLIQHFEFVHDPRSRIPARRVFRTIPTNPAQAKMLFGPFGGLKVEGLMLNLILKRLNPG